MITPGRWHWWTSNSWTRLRSDDGQHSHAVLSPVVLSDGQPHIEVSPDDMALIEAAPDMLTYLKDQARSCQFCGGSGDHPTILKLCPHCRVVRDLIEQATTVKR